jgi:Flp pilus assembly protein TadG
MRKRLQHLRRGERGIATIYLAVGFMAFMAVSTLAIDVGMFMTARNQAQNSADAGALAGAVALVYNSFDNRTPSGPAVQNALGASTANQVMGANVSVQSGDVSFPTGPTGINNRVRVYVYRTTPRGNPIPTLIGGTFGVRTVDVIAMATAEASQANSIRCVKPFIIPDKWIENQTGPWDPVNDTFDMYDNRGNLLPNADVYKGDLNSPNYTGYNPVRDRGLELVLRAGSGNNIAPTAYFSWSMPGNPGEIGGDWYRDNIAHCNPTLVSPNFIAIQEPGNMEGPTTAGIDDLIAQDSGAYWEGAPGCNCVKGSRYGGLSPRIFPIPVYDPVYYTEGKINGRNADFKVANIIGFFVTRRTGNQIYGKITPITGEFNRNLGPAPTGFFAQTIRLVE